MHCFCSLRIVEPYVESDRFCLYCTVRDVHRMQQWLVLSVAVCAALVAIASAAPRAREASQSKVESLEARIARIEGALLKRDGQQQVQTQADQKREAPLTKKSANQKRADLPAKTETEEREVEEEAEEEDEEKREAGVQEEAKQKREPQQQSQKKRESQQQTQKREPQQQTQKREPQQQTQKREPKQQKAQEKRQAHKKRETEEEEEDEEEMEEEREQVGDVSVKEAKRSVNSKREVLNSAKTAYKQKRESVGVFSKRHMSAKAREAVDE